jgi:transcriptional regulatory protein RtcR
MDEQTMLLKAVEEGRYLPMGADTEVESRFQLIAGTNADLNQAVSEGRFREDLLARINIWTFALPGLKDRPEDIEPNLDYELRHVLAVCLKSSSLCRSGPHGLRGNPDRVTDTFAE